MFRLIVAGVPGPQTLLYGLPHEQSGKWAQEAESAAIQALALTLSGAAAMAAAYDDTEVAEMKVNSNGSLSESLTDA